MRINNPWLRLAWAGGILISASAIFMFLCFYNVTLDLFVGTLGVLATSMVAIYIAIKRKNVASLLLLAFILRVVMSILYSTVMGDADPDGYGDLASNLASMGLSDFLINIPLGAHFYSWLIAIVWSFTGESYFLIRVLNAFIGFVTIVLAYDLSRKLFSDQVAKRILIILAFFPSLLRFTSSFTSRDTLLMFLLVVIIVFSYKFLITPKFRHFVAVIVSTILATILHSAFFIIGSLIFIGVLFLQYRDSRTGKVRAVPYILLILIVGLALLSSGVGTEKLYLDNGAVNEGRILMMQDGSVAAGRSAYLTDSSPDSLGAAIINLPVRAIFFMFTPFIWMIRTPLDILGFIDSFIYAYLIYKMAQGFRIRNNELGKNNKNYLAVIAIATTVGILLFSFATTNYGTALRHRAKFAIPIAIMAGVNPTKRKRGTRR